MEGEGWGLSFYGLIVSGAKGFNDRTKTEILSLILQSMHMSYSYLSYSFSYIYIYFHIFIFIYIYSYSFTFIHIHFHIFIFIFRIYNQHNYSSNLSNILRGLNFDAKLLIYNL